MGNTYFGCTEGAFLQLLVEWTEKCITSIGHTSTENDDFRAEDGDERGNACSQMVDIVINESFALFVTNLCPIEYHLGIQIFSRCLLGMTNQGRSRTVSLETTALSAGT